MKKRTEEAPPKELTVGALSKNRTQKAPEGEGIEKESSVNAPLRKGARKKEHERKHGKSPRERAHRGCPREKAHGGRPGDRAHGKNSGKITREKSPNQKAHAKGHCEKAH